MSKKWMQKVSKGLKHGALHRELGIPSGKKIPAGTLAAAAQKDGILGKRARLAETFRHARKK